MKQRLFESPLLLLSVCKWFVMASAIGLLVGTSTAIFLQSLSWSIRFMRQCPVYFWLLPVALPISGYLIQTFAPEAEGYGARVIEAIHKHSGRIPPLVVPVKFFATLITIACGGSAGKTGPGVQIGAGLASICAVLLHLNDTDRKKVASCAISAAFAATFGTVVAGALFGSEVLYIGALFYHVLFPSFIAGLVSRHVALYWGLSYPAYDIPAIPVFNELFVGKVVLAGVLFGLCALFLIESLHVAERTFDRIALPDAVKGCLAGIALIGLTYIFSDQYLGLGTDTIDACLRGESLALQTWAVKILFVVITLHFCGSGGIITPILFVGATAGNALGQMMRVDPAFFSAIGMVSLLAGAANTPLTSVMMATELFSHQLAHYAAIACLTSFLMAGHRTVYPSQVLFISKSTYLDIETQKEVRQIDDIYVTTEKLGVMGMMLAWHRKRKRR